MCIHFIHLKLLLSSKLDTFDLVCGQMLPTIFIKMSIKDYSVV